MVERPQTPPITFDERKIRGNGREIDILKIHGELDIDTSPVVRDHLIALIEAGARRVIVNLDDVAYLDSTALGVLLTALKKSLERQGRLVLVSANPKINRVFSITGVSKILNIFDTEADAVRNLSE